MKNIFPKLGKRLKKYCSLILKSKYDREITEDLVETYLEARYLNSGVDEEIKIFYRRIFDALKREAEELVKANKENREKVENHLFVFQYLFYFDFVRSNLSTDEVIDDITEKRLTKFNLKSAENDNFNVDFKELVNDDMNETLDYLDNFDTPKFLIDYSRISRKNSNISRVNFYYNFDFPEIFNKATIEETFNTDIIAEDKLYVEYPMIAAIALREVLVGNFRRIYVVDFATSLFGKAKKLDQIVGVIENPAAQEKIMLEIKYDDFVKNKNGVFKLMKRGFKFCLKTSEDMKKLSNDELQLLNVFSLVIVDSGDVNKKYYTNTNAI